MLSVPRRSLMALPVAALVMLGLQGCRSGGPPVPPQPPAPPPAGPRVLFGDDFQEYRPWWRSVRGNWQRQQLPGPNGQGAVWRLAQSLDDPKQQNAIYFVEPQTFSDVEIVTQLILTAALPQFQTAEDQELLRTRRLFAGAGLVFRYQDENNFYMFRLAGEEGAVLGKMVDGKWQDLANPRTASFFSGGRIAVNTPYTLRVRLSGDWIRCWINDNAAANLRDQSFSTGRLGLVTFRTTALFAGIRVTE